MQFVYNDAWKVEAAAYEKNQYKFKDKKREQANVMRAGLIMKLK